jgi:hypothetical protein
MNWHHIKLNNIRWRLFGCAAIGVILGAAGCIPGKSYPRDAIEAPVAVYLVEESIDAYVPVRAIKSPALDDFINNPRDLVSVSSNGHAADGYYVQMAIVKANSAQCVIWSFANSGEFVVQDKVVRVSRNGEVAFMPKNENLPFKFFKSPTLSNIARGLQTVR